MILDWIPSEVNTVSTLSFQSVLITRPRDQAEPLRALIEKTGRTVVLFPTIEILPSQNQLALYQRMQALHDYDIIIFVSANAVLPILPQWQASPSLSVIAIGPGTTEMLRQHGISVDRTPSTYSS